MEGSQLLGVAYRSIEEYRSVIEERNKQIAGLVKENEVDKENLAQIVAKAEELKQII